MCAKFRYESWLTLALLLSDRPRYVRGFPLPFVGLKQAKSGVFPSQMTAGGKQDDQKSSLEGTGKGQSNPAGRPGDEKDMAGTILFLASRAGV